MKVKELIQELSKFNPDARVYLEAPDLTTVLCVEKLTVPGGTVPKIVGLEPI